MEPFATIFGRYYNADDLASLGQQTVDFAKEHVEDITKITVEEIETIFGIGFFDDGVLRLLAMIRRKGKLERKLQCRRT